MKTNVTVTLKNGILDPQGKAVEHALHSLGFSGVRGVRVGKFIEIEMDPSAPEQAKKEAEEMCKKLLANPVMENFRVTVAEKGN